MKTVKLSILMLFLSMFCASAQNSRQMIETDFTSFELPEEMKWAPPHKGWFSFVTQTHLEYNKTISRQMAIYSDPNSDWGLAYEYFHNGDGSDIKLEDGKKLAWVIPALKNEKLAPPIWKPIADGKGYRGEQIGRSASIEAGKIVEVLETHIFYVKKSGKDLHIMTFISTKGALIRPEVKEKMDQILKSWKVR